MKTYKTINNFIKALRDKIQNFLFNDFENQFLKEKKTKSITFSLKTNDQLKQIAISKISKSNFINLVFIT